MKIALSGYYGFNNSGDEALLSAITTTIKRIEPGAEFVVFSGSPGQTARLHGLKAVNRVNPVAVIRELLKSELLISGGGSLFQDVTGPFSLPYYISIVALAKFLKKPVIFYAQGVGPIQRSWSRYLMNKVANRVDLITLRDGASRDLLKEIGVIRPPVKITADPVFSLEPAPRDYENMKNLLNQYCPGAEKIAGISVRKWPPLADKLPELARMLDMLKKDGFSIVFIPLDYPSDLAESRSMADRMKESAQVVEQKLTSQEHAALMAQMQIMIGMRLHSLVFAANQSVPFAGISYDPKVDAFLSLFGQKPLQGDASAMKLQLEEILNDVNAREKNHKIARELKTRAVETAYLALSLVNKKDTSC